MHVITKFLQRSRKLKQAILVNNYAQQGYWVTQTDTSCCRVFRELREFKYPVEVT